MSKDVFSMYIAFEMMSISSYTLVTYHKDRWEPVEAGIKYVMMNATGTMLAVFGIAMLFLSAGTLDMDTLVTMGLRADNPINEASIILVIVGFGVKAAIVPMHTWLPDAYSSASTGIAAVLGGVVTPVGLLAMVKVLATAFVGERQVIGGAFIALSVVSMVVGNITALGQTDVKRMLAYSSIAQMGYMLMGFGFGFATGSHAGLQGALYHMVTNAAMKSLAFFSAGILISAAGTHELSGLAGSGLRRPWAGAAFTVACLSLAGVPPLAGFMSKMIIYRSGLEAESPLGYFMTALAISCSVLSLGYYLPAIARIFDVRGNAARATEPASVLSSTESIRQFAVYAPVVALGLVTVLLGFYPGAPLDHAASVMSLVVRSFAP
jgi:proton-translocating NADH-quinone oxidoreductase chain N